MVFMKKHPLSTLDPATKKGRNTTKTKVSAFFYQFNGSAWLSLFVLVHAVNHHAPKSFLFTLALMYFCVILRRFYGFYVLINKEDSYEYCFGSSRFQKD